MLRLIFIRLESVVFADLSR